jgi:hypothetical protein
LRVCEVCEKSAKDQREKNSLDRIRLDSTNHFLISFWWISDMCEAL